MKLDRDSQQGSEEGKKNKREVKGYMALRNNVLKIKMDLWKELKPLEYFVLDIIIAKTIGWCVKEAKISIQDFMTLSDQDHTRIYRTLKSLEQKKIIVRKKHNHNLIFGLNEEYFGSLLIKRHQEALDRRKRIKVVVDNSKNLVLNQHNSCDQHAQLLCEICTKKYDQDGEIIHEKAALNTLLKDISFKAPQNPEGANGTVESCALEENGAKTGKPSGKKEFNLEARKAVLKQQAEMLQAQLNKSIL